MLPLMLTTLLLLAAALFPPVGGPNFDFYFFVQMIKDLTEELNLHWNKLSCPSSNNSPFWNHEWSKHGTCSGLTEHAYFKTALNLYTTYNLTAALASAGRSTVSSFCALNPSPGAQLMWSNEMIADILPNGQLYTSKLILKSLIPCPVTIPNQCRAIVYFPPF
ncbi:unnamed protein product [Sphagnum jensenii]|uniref:Uncharacterized protein n=1 Tax=Sphagnum jensenii TaxID=128206 RepID=A0ABP0WM48_9BRYO